jgi:aryl-alcohol dehydrogenase-like predicted oxidoreductase
VAKADLERYPLASNLTICRILNGMWQVAGGHGHIDSRLAIAEMMKYHDAGFTTWDLADIYGPAEDFIGEFRQQLLSQRGSDEITQVRALTKWVPQPVRVTRRMVNESISRSLNRMKVDVLDLVQFHWWDYNNPYYMDALTYLSDLRDSGKVKHIGLTNFDTERIEDMIDAGLKIVSNQVQYSIVDRRPEVKMAQLCQNNHIQLLAYGTLCGGLVSEKYFGRSEPSLRDLDTLSLRKYKRMIDAWGGWGLFQKLLSTLKDISEKHGVSIANVATRYILDKPAVAGVIIGARLGITDHRYDNARTFALKLDGDDQSRIDQIHNESNDLFEAIGDCGDEYR